MPTWQHLICTARIDTADVTGHTVQERIWGYLICTVENTATDTVADTVADTAAL